MGIYAGNMKSTIPLPIFTFYKNNIYQHFMNIIPNYGISFQ